MSVFKRGTVYWFEFVFDGQRIQRSTKQGNRKAAVEIESAFRTALAKGEVGIIEPKKEARTIGNLLDLLAQQYRDDEGRVSSQNKSLLARVRRDFGSQPAAKLTAEDVTRYVTAQRSKAVAPATINRKLQVLHRCFTVADILAPKIKLLPLDNARKGFFSPAEMAALLPKLPDDGLRDLVRFAYATGMRSKEVRSLRFESLQDGVLRLEAKDAKTRVARTVPVDSGELAAIIERRKAARLVRCPDGSITASPFIFHRGDGLPIGQFRKSWKTACRAAGITGKIFHDIRRSAVRDLVRAGVPQSVAMSISGHKTPSVFLRYNITDESDKRNALAAAAVYREQQQKSVVSM